MKTGDLVVLLVPEKTVGIVVGFDRFNDPIVYEPGSGIKRAVYRYQVEVISETR